jgi:hypothetical protein
VGGRFISCSSRNVFIFGRRSSRNVSDWSWLGLLGSDPHLLLITIIDQ